MKNLSLFVCAFFLAIHSMGCSLPQPQAGSASLDYAVFALDTSSSAVSGDGQSRCAELAESVRLLLKESRARRFGVLAIGTGEANGEPRVLVDVTLERKARGFHAREERTGAEAEFLREVRCSCATRVKVATYSPIYRAVAGAAASLRARCLAADGGLLCGRAFLLVHSDLHESQEPALREALRRPDAAHLRGLRSLTVILPPSATAQVCGVADSRDAQGVAVQTLEAVWRPVLGVAAPAAFAASCPQSLATGDECRPGGSARKWGE